MTDTPPNAPTREEWDALTARLVRSGEIVDELIELHNDPAFVDPVGYMEDTPPELVLLALLTATARLSGAAHPDPEVPYLILSADIEAPDEAALVIAPDGSLGWLQPATTLLNERYHLNNKGVHVDMGYCDAFACQPLYVLRHTAPGTEPKENTP